MQIFHLDARTAAAIERTLREGNRVELIPVKDGVKIFAAKRKEIKLSDPPPQASGGKG